MHHTRPCIAPAPEASRGCLAFMLLCSFLCRTLAVEWGCCRLTLRRTQLCTDTCVEILGVEEISMHKAHVLLCSMCPGRCGGMLWTCICTYWYFPRDRIKSLGESQSCLPSSVSGDLNWSFSFVFCLFFFFLSHRWELGWRETWEGPGCWMCSEDNDLGSEWA